LSHGRARRGAPLLLLLVIQLLRFMMMLQRRLWLRLVLLVLYSLKLLDKSRILQRQLAELVCQVWLITRLLLNLDVGESERDLHSLGWGLR